MLKTIIVVAAMALLTSCTKKEKDKSSETERHCPTISQSAVPSVVVSAFQTKYPSTLVITWFQKDSVGYCAYFIQSPNLKKLAEFTPTGIFVSEETDLNHDGQFEDSTGTVHSKSSTVCNCEIPE